MTGKTDDAKQTTAENVKQGISNTPQVNGQDVINNVDLLNKTNDEPQKEKVYSETNLTTDSIFSTTTGERKDGGEKVVHEEEEEVDDHHYGLG